MDELAAENYVDFEPLPALLEDEENVSLTDVLSLRDSCLTEQEIWAVCLECSQSLKSIAHSAIFQTLCITPDTLAFNTNGNVCFMEQISDDPEGVFMSPEIDVTGNTFEAHVFSLGATLQAVIEYMMDMETETEFSQDLHTLLKQMQEENPKERPDVEAVISLCKEKLNLSSSNDICRCLSAVGRRILSIESCDRLQVPPNGFLKTHSQLPQSHCNPAVIAIPTVFPHFEKREHRRKNVAEHNCSERDGYRVEDIPHESRESEMNSNEQET